MRNKKAMLDWLTCLILALIFLIVVSYFGFVHIGKGSSDLDAHSYDFDKDDVLDSIDKCACNEGLMENRGCPLGDCIDGYTDEQKELCEKKMAGEGVDVIC